MSTQRDDSVYLKHIRDAIAKTLAYVKEVSKSAFLRDTLIQDAVIRQIEIIGEAAKCVSDKRHELKVSTSHGKIFLGCATSSSTTTLVWILKKSGLQ